MCGDSVSSRLLLRRRLSLSPAAQFPDFWSIIVGNALLAAAYGILWCGARKFDGKKISIVLALVGCCSG